MSGQRAPEEDTSSTPVQPGLQISSDGEHIERPAIEGDKRKRKPLLGFSRPCRNPEILAKSVL